MRRIAALAACLLLLTGCGRLVRFRRYDVRSGSMEPTLQVGDRVSCTTRVPPTLDRAAVVAFDHDGTTFLKRVIGLPGEVVASPDGRAVTIGGAPLAEPYLSGDDTPQPFERVTVPEGTYFVMGDNRDRSSDSRTQGPLAHAAVRGVCTKIVAPKARRGRIAGT